MARTEPTPKVLYFDIETAPNLAYVWAKYEQDVIAFENHWYILCFAYKWAHEDKVHAVSLPMTRGYKKDKTNDKELCRMLWELFDEADVVIGHNSDQFDIKKARARFIQHGFTPYAPFQSVDTVKLARKQFRFDSNKLDDLGDYLGVGRKIHHEGFEAVWLGCMVRDEPKAWKKMMDYNKQDVALLERVYEQMKPWSNSNPNLNLYRDTLRACPTCGSADIIRKGFRFNKASKHQRFKCNSCGSWSSLSKKDLALVTPL